jgi:hypothetical protein
MTCPNCGGRIEAYPVVTYARGYLGIVHREDRYRCSVCMTGYDVNPKPKPRVQGPFTFRADGRWHGGDD